MAQTQKKENDSALRPSDSVRMTTSADGAILLDIQQGICFSLNPLGLKIWMMLKEHQSVELIEQSLAAEFEQPEKQIHIDVHEFIDSLRAKKLVSDVCRGGQNTPRLGSTLGNGRLRWIYRLLPRSVRN